MRRRFASVAALAVATLAFAGCSATGDGPSATAPSIASSTVTSSSTLSPAQASASNSVFALACNAFQNLGGAASVRVTDAYEDVKNMSLSAAARAEAQKIIDQGFPPAREAQDNPQHPEECQGAVWERYYAGVRQRTGGGNSTPTTGPGSYYGGPQYLIEALTKGGFECSDVSPAPALYDGENAAKCKTGSQYGGVYMAVSTFDSQDQVASVMQSKLKNPFASPSTVSADLYGYNWIVSCLPGAPDGAKATCEAVQRIIRGTLAD